VSGFLRGPGAHPRESAPRVGEAVGAHIRPERDRPPTPAYLVDATKEEAATKQDCPRRAGKGDKSPDRV
jgi:hypothetical protein